MNILKRTSFTLSITWLLSISYSPYEDSLHRQPPPTSTMLRFAFASRVPPHLKCIIQVPVQHQLESCSLGKHVSRRRWRLNVTDVKRHHLCSCLSVTIHSSVFLCPVIRWCPCHTRLTWKLSLLWQYDTNYIAYPYRDNLDQRFNSILLFCNNFVQV